MAQKIIVIGGFKERTFGDKGVKVTEFDGMVEGADGASTIQVRFAHCADAIKAKYPPNSVIEGAELEEGKPFNERRQFIWKNSGFGEARSGGGGGFRPAEPRNAVDIDTYVELGTSLTWAYCRRLLNPPQGVQAPSPAEAFEQACTFARQGIIDAYLRISRKTE